MTDLVVDEEFYVEDTHIYKSMMDVATEEELWQYLRGPFIGNLFPEDCYSKQNSSECRGKVYRNNYLVGGVRLRQLRVSADSLKTKIKHAKVCLLKERNQFALNAIRTGIIERPSLTF